MPANFKPIFPLVPNIGFTRQTAANTATDGTGTVAPIMTAGANGARCDKLICVAGGTNVATVLRVFINNGGATSTATNNSLLCEVSLPATTASATAQNGPRVEVPIDMTLPNGYKITVCIATAVSAGWHITQLGGDY
jgi:hypothetical protein